MTSHDESLRGAAVKAFWAKLKGHGMDPNALLEAAISQRQSSTNNLEAHNLPPSIHEIIETAATLSGDPAFAIQLGREIDIADFGAYGFAIMSAPNLGAALDLFFRYGKLFFLPFSSWYRVELGTSCAIRLVHHSGTNYQKMLVTEFAFSQFQAVSDLLVKRPHDVVVVHCDFPKPPHFAAYEACWPYPIEFDKEYAQFFVPTELLGQSIRTGDPATNVLFTQQCEEILGGMSKVKGTTAAVRRSLLYSAGKLMKISDVADQLHVSERTLRRRLTDEATDFRTIFDEVRNTLACNYLRKTSLSVVEISDILHYNESTNFHRAFQRWNSTTPTEYRRRSATFQQ